MIAGSYESDRPINITGIDKVPLKGDCINRSIMDGKRETVLYSFGLISLPGQKIYKEPTIKLFKKVKKKSVLSHIIFYLKDDDHKPIDFNNETIGFTCQPKNIYFSYAYTYLYNFWICSIALVFILGFTYKYTIKEN